MKKKIIYLTVFFVIIDQLIKLLVVNNLDVDTGFKVIPSFFSILYVRNTGAAWGIMSNGTLVLALFSIFFLIFAIKYVIELKNINYYKILSYSLLFGGIIGNLIDRILRNYVVDFLSFNIFSYSFPIFNVADCFIVISIVLIIIEMIYESNRSDNNDSKRE